MDLKKTLDTYQREVIKNNKSLGYTLNNLCTLISIVYEMEEAIQGAEKNIEYVVINRLGRVLYNLCIFADNHNMLISDIVENRTIAELNEMCENSTIEQALMMFVNEIKKEKRVDCNEIENIIAMVYSRVFPERTEESLVEEVLQKSIAKMNDLFNQ